MSENPCSYGRELTRAMASMNMRAVVAAYVTYFARPADGRGVAALDPVPAAFRPRGEDGRFVSYASLRDAIGFEYYLSDDQYQDAEGGRS